MGHHFTTDGRELINVEDPTDPQILLQEQLDTYESVKQQRFDDLRSWRGSELGTSDWTQVSDSALDSTTKAAWATYRDKLRDLPANAKAPDQFAKSDWPLAPGQSEVADNVYVFIAEFDDPLGIGTTSWVGNGTETTTIFTTDTQEISGIGTNIISISESPVGTVVANDVLKTGSISGTVAGLGTTSIIDLQTTIVSYDIAVGQSIIAVDNIGDINFGEIFESGSISSTVIGVGTAAVGGTVYNTVSLASTISSALDADSVVKFRRQIPYSVSLASTISSGIGTGDVITFDRSKSVLVEQTRPSLIETIGLSTTKVVAGGSFDITITDTYTTAEESYDYEIGVRDYPNEDIITSPIQGQVTIIPSGTTGVSTITVSIASTIGAGGTVGDVEDQQSFIAGRNFVIDVNVDKTHQKYGEPYVGLAATVGVTTT